MPQMAPLMWLMLFFMFITIFMFFNILNYFNFPKVFIPSNESNPKNSYNNSMPWKW